MPEARDISLFPGESIRFIDGTMVRAVSVVALELGTAPETIDWPAVMRDLKMAGWTQQRVAKSTGCSQSAIAQLNSGRTKEPTYSLGVRLVALHAQVIRSEVLNA